MRPETLYLTDIIEAADAIARFLDGLQREDFLDDVGGTWLIGRYRIRQRLHHASTFIFTVEKAAPGHSRSGAAFSMAR